MVGLLSKSESKTDTKNALKTKTNGKVPIFGVRPLKTVKVFLTFLIKKIYLSFSYKGPIMEAIESRKKFLLILFKKKIKSTYKTEIFQVCSQMIPVRI